MIEDYLYSNFERLWSKIDKKSDDECWNWKNDKFPDGYGKFYFKGKTVRVHRLVYEIAYHKQPANLQVLHKCDNRACCNPNHLFLGTHQDNMTDMKNKKRGTIGRRPIFKLTLENIDIIRLKYNSGEFTTKDLAKEFNVSPSQIGNIISNRSSVSNTYVRIKKYNGCRYGENNNSSKLTQKDVDKIRDLYNKGVKISKIAVKFKVTSTNIYYIVKYKSWNNKNNNLP